MAAMVVGEDFHPVDRGFAELYGLGRSGAVLVRPDGYLARRLTDPGGDASAVLHSAVDLVLGRAGEAVIPSRPLTRAG
jgi:putative polyketide hydroxylase